MLSWDSLMRLVSWVHCLEIGLFSKTQDSVLKTVSWDDFYTTLSCKSSTRLVGWSHFVILIFYLICSVCVLYVQQCSQCIPTRILWQNELGKIVKTFDTFTLSKCHMESGNAIKTAGMGKIYFWKDTYVISNYILWCIFSTKVSYQRYFQKYLPKSCKTVTICNKSQHPISDSHCIFAELCWKNGTWHHKSQKPRNILSLSCISSDSTCWQQWVIPAPSSTQPTYIRMWKKLWLNEADERDRSGGHLTRPAGLKRGRTDADVVVAVGGGPDGIGGGHQSLGEFVKMTVAGDRSTLH